MEDADSNTREANTAPEPPSSTFYNIMENPSACAHQIRDFIGSTHADNNRINERTRSRSPAAREEERTAVTNALVQSAKALSAVINTKRGPHLPSRVVASMAHDFYSANIAKALPPLVPPPFPTTAKTPAKAPARASAQTPAKAPAKASTKASANTSARAPAKASAKTSARAPAKTSAKTSAQAPAKAVDVARPKVPAKAR